jgi:hypothetical protein
VEIGPQIRYVGIGQAKFERRHHGTALFDFGGDGIVADGVASNQVLALIEIL